ncbi:MAG: hypothetical protein HY698_15690 [Deltaproteobacteria bacterium]|nr:hypothetical protein [Deltaproteobacteria bacterium]
MRLLALAFLVLSCASPNKDWKDALGTMAGSGSTYSFAYEGEPPSGTQLRLALYAEDLIGACGLYTSEKPPGDFWMLSVTTPAASAGVYEIARTKGASARLVRVREGEKAAKYPAISGRVEILSVPSSTEAFRAGERMTGRIVAGFPVHPAHAIECSGGGSEGGEVEFECQCREESGKEFKCIASAEDGACCTPTSGETVQLEIDFDAAPCAGMCASTSPELFRYCLELK